jgi:hypothetical protein
MEEDLKKHLEEIRKIIIDFKSEYQFNEHYLSIKGKFDEYDEYCRVKVNSEFDNLTRREIKDIENSLSDSISDYLKANNIKNVLTIKDAPSTNWAKNGTILNFKVSLKV